MNGSSPPASLLGPARPRTTRPRFWVRRLVVVGTVLAMVGAGTTAYAVSEVSELRAGYEGRVLPGAVVAGVDLGGMTYGEAVQAVEAVVAPQLDRVITVRHGDRLWTRTAGELGSASNAEEVLGAVVAASEGVAWRDWFDHRWRGAPLGFEQLVDVDHGGAQAGAWLAEIAAEVNLAPRDAVLDTSSGWVQVVRGSYGLVADTDATTAAVRDALADPARPDEVELITHDLVPAVTSADFDQVLLVRHNDHRLYLYRGGRITHSWPVALGASESGYPTPKGVFEVTLKRRSPTWVNPDPTGWGKDMPAQIPPGPGNPLGERAINWSVGAIRFHGTANVDSIGTNASKGCVRLSNPDVIELFELVDEGATIVSL